MARASTQQLADEIDGVVGKYADRISNAEAIGVLVLQIFGIVESAQDDGDEDDE